jgi:hypothetical protein
VEAGESVSDGRYYAVRVDEHGYPDPETGPRGPLSRDEALSRRTGPDPLSGWRTIALQVTGEADAEPEIRTEYGIRDAGGEYRTLTTTPRLEEIYPLADRIAATRRDYGHVYRRRFILVEDWTEVDEP